MNKKERRLAMATALQSAAADIVVVESAALAEPKTKSLVEALASVGADPMSLRSVLLVAADVGDGLQRASRNVERLTVNKVSALNASDVLKADKIVVERAALEAIQEFYGPSSN